MHAPGTDAPCSPRAHATPATYAAQPSTLPGRNPSSANSTGSSSALLEACTIPSDVGDTVAVTPSGSAMGSTKPSL